MERSLVQRECCSSITQAGGYAFKVRDAIICPTCHTEIVPTGGRPDYFCTLGTYGFLVEVKAARSSFAFSLFTERQREFAKWYVNDLHGDIYIWLSMGMRVNSREYPRKTWFIPLKDFLVVEALIGEYQNSLPYLAEKGYKLELQDQQLDAVHLLASWELEWQGGGLWSVNALSYRR